LSKIPLNYGGDACLPPVCQSLGAGRKPRRRQGGGLALWSKFCYSTG